MKILKNYIGLSLSFLVLGCTSYPEQGTGDWLKVMIPLTIKIQIYRQSCLTNHSAQNTAYALIGN